MKKIDKDDLLNWLSIIAIILFLVIALVCAVIKVWVVYEYADTPISEVPAWAWYWLQSGGK